MSDFFYSNQNDPWSVNNKPNFQNTDTEKNTDIWEKAAQNYQEKKQIQLENRYHYGVTVPDEIYEVFNQMTSRCSTPEEANEMSYKLGSACKYMELMGLGWNNFEEVFNNVDNFNAVQYPNLQNQKSRYEALCDALQIGKNNVKLGELGQKLLKAHRENDTELANSVMAEVNAINQQNVLLQDNVPRHFIMQELEAGAQSLPFTGAAAAAGVFGNFIVPGAGTAASFAVSSYLATGSEYIDMIANGSTPETARTMALISGGIQGIIEANLGITSGIVKGSARLMGKEVAENFAKNKLKEIESKVLKRVHFGPVKRTIVNYLERRTGDVLGEGAEEFWQETTSVLGKEVAACLDGYDIPDDDIKSIVKQTTEAFKGGVLGALGLGLIPGFNPARMQAYADIANDRIVRKAAETIPSETMFKEAVKDNPIFKDMSEEQKNSDIHEIWERAQARIDAEATAEAKKIAEIQDAAEGSEELKLDDKGEAIPAGEVARDEKTGKLYTEDEVFYDDEDNPTGGRFLIGDNKTVTESEGKKGFARYGYISWEFADGDQNKIIINDFKMAKGREGIRAEAFNDFAVQHPGTEIEWNTKSSEAQIVKKMLAENNPSGAKNGLNYYADENAVADASTRAWVDKQVDEHISDYKKVKGTDGKEYYVKTKLSKNQRAAAVALIESAAKRMNMSITDYVNKTFGTEIFGTAEEFTEEAAAQGDSVSGKAGGVKVGTAQQGDQHWKEFGQQVKAVIYAGEHADFSTWAHELAHIFQNQLEGELKTKAENAFGVKNGDWQHSMYKFKNGDVMPAAEAFAYGFQDWLKTGKAENEQMKNIFKKFAEFIAQAYNSLKDFINLTPEIKDVYNQLLSGDDSLLKAAEMAVEDQDRRYRAEMKRQAQEKENQKKAEAEQQKKCEEAEREEASETTEFTEEEKELTPEEAEKNLQEATNETEEKNSAIDDALENSNLTDEEKTQIAETLKDETTTVIEKAEAGTNAASSVYDDDEAYKSIPEDLFFQLAGEPSIRRMAEGEEKERILTDLKTAQLLDEKYKNMDAASKAARIRRATGWEKDANGAWKYELDDSINRIKTEVFKNNPQLLTDSSASTLLNLGDILDAPELFEVFPYMKNVRVNFYSDPNAFRAVLTPNGIMVNTRYLKGMNGETGLKGVLAHEIQHVIQAMEFADSKGLQGADIKQLYNDVMDAMKAAGERKYDYDTTSLQAGLDAYMKDAGEIEARNVARRILMNADQRRMNTLASTEDVKRNLLFQHEIEKAGKNMEVAVNSSYDEYANDEVREKAETLLNSKIDGYTGYNRDGAKVWSIYKDLKQHKGSEIVGKKIEVDANARPTETGWNQLREILDIFRNKSFETFRYVLIDQTGEIKKQYAVTAKMPGVTPIGEGKTTAEKINYLQAIADEAANTDCKIVFLHNHPSGNVQQSPQDEQVTGLLRQVPSLYLGNMILDHNTYNLNIESDANEFVWNQHTIKISEKDNLIKQPRKHKDILNREVTTYTDLDDIADKLNDVDNGMIPVCFSNFDAQITSVAYIPEELFTSNNIQKLRKNLEDTALKAGTCRTFAITNNSDIYDFINTNNSVLRFGDVVLHSEGQSDYTHLDLGNSYLFYDLSKAEGQVTAFQNEADYQEAIEKAKQLLFQNVYHGSPHNFDKFSTENIGTGEGAQAFGWGLYFTNQEGIARFYADKLANEPKRISLISKNEFLKSRKKSLKDVENKEKYEAKIIKNINHFKKELKQAQKAGDENDIKFYEGLIDDSIKQLDDKERLSYVEAFKKDIANTEQEIAELKASMKNNRNLYTVEIPDEGYLLWDKNVSYENIEGIKQALKDKGITDFTRLDNLIENQKKWENDPNATYTFGSNIYKVISDYLGSDKAASLFLKDLGYIGIDYPANSLSGYTSQDERNYVIFDEASANIKKHLLYQNAYHGSGADFNKFDTENYGYSGEGSMSFGYGTYVTDSEEIARDYAERSKNAANGSYTEAMAAIQDIKNAIADVEKKLERTDLSERVRYTDEKTLQELEQKLRYLESTIPEPVHLYTVDIPDNGYIVWDKPVRKQTADKIKRALFNEITTNPDSAYYNYYSKSDLMQELDSVFSYMEGQQLYNNVSAYLEGDEKASKFLHKIGYVGLKYPAGTIHGNGRDAYNYVIFNDDDAKIVDHLFYQTEAELQDEALTFDSWQAFMEYCETVHVGIDEVSPIPFNADAQWYQSFYETAHGIQTEQEKNEDEVTEKIKKDGMLPNAVDAMFATYVRTYPEMVDNFLKAVADIDAMDLDSEEWQHVEDEEGAKQRERYDQLKDYIDITLSDYNWQTAIKRVQGGHEIAEGLRKRLIGEMLDNFKIRDFRAIYAEVMDDAQFAVDEEDSTIAQLNKKLSKYKKFDILKPNEDVSRVSPERRKRIAEALQNREIAEKIRNGSLKLDDEIEAYLKSLDKQVKDLQKDYNELEKETKNDYQRLADAERRKLLKLHEELLLARGKLKRSDAETERKIKKGLKITEKYQKASQNLTANYDELFRKFTDLKNTMQITAEVQAALDRQEAVAGLKENLNNKQKEKNLIAEVKKMRIQLVKRAMRRVPFNRIDYENARTVIAIQRMLEPNLMGGVNRFIGIDSAYLRGVISGIVTDSDYKEKILNYLRKQDKSSQAFVDFLKKVEELKSIKDFDSWTAKERKYAIKHLPKENWVRDLNLQQLAKEREESIDLDIGMKEKLVQRIDPKTGRVMQDKEGNPIYETTFVLDAAEDLKKLVRDAVGADMYDLITDKPFAEWTTEELERLAQRIDELYTEGRDMYAAKLEARRRENDAIRKRVEDAIKETGITINDDDTPEEKERKAEKIAKILNQKSGLKGTEAGKNSGIKAKFDRLIHGYADANVLRVARILDNYSEGENVRLLYRREDECYNNKTRSIIRRGETVKKVMADNKITEGSLAEVVKVSSLGTEFTVDELLYFLAADKDFEIDEKKAARPYVDPLDINDDYAATSRNAVMFGNMMSDNASQDLKEQWAQEDRDMQEAIENDTLTTEQKQELAIGQLDKRPGTTKFINACKAKWSTCLQVANNYLSMHPEYNALLEAIEADYAEQYERMNEISINEFNTPVHRVRAYVPLVRRESNGADNVQQVKEDLLAAYGGEAGKQWVNKGMTQRRQNISPLNQKPVQTGLFRTWGDSIERTEHFIAYAPYVRQLNAVYKSRDAAYTRRFIEARYGKPMLEYIDSYINEVANPNAGKVRERGAEFLHILRGKTAPAYLGWKFSGIVKQGLTSPWPYMQFVNPAEYLAAATKCWTSGGKYYDAIKEKSAYMASRVMDPINELVDEMAENAKSKVDRAWSKFAKTGMQGLEWIDWTCVAPGWLACYEKEYNRLQNMSEARYQEKIAALTEKNMTAEVGTSEWMSREQIEQAAKEELMNDIELAAVTYADDCTRACQPSSRLTDLAPLFKNSSEAMKAFLQFQTSLNVIWQNIRYDIPYHIRQKEFNKIVGTVCGYVLAGIFMNSVMDGVKGDDDDDETQALRNLIYYSTTQFTDAIPMIGSEITNVMDKVITGKRAYSQSGTDMTPSVTKLMKALEKVTSGDFKKAAELTAEGIGLGLGAPVSGTKEIYKLLGKPLSEGDVNLKRGVSDVYGIAGDIIEQ